MFLFLFSSLIFTIFDGTFNDGDIVRYFIDTNTSITIHENNETSPLCLAVDSENEIIYWVNYTDVSYALIGTFYNGTTIILKEYNGTTASVKIAVGEKDFYVLDSPNGRIDRFDRENRTFQDYFVVADAPTDLTVVQGELKRKRGSYVFFRSLFVSNCQTDIFSLSC